MDLIKVFNKEDISEEKLSSFRMRIAVRAVVLDDKKNIAMLYLSKNGFYSLPGGGVEKSESLEETVIRECWEETGCKVKIIHRLGKIDEVKSAYNLINRSYGYIVKVVGEKGPLHLEENERRQGLELYWMDLYEAMKLLKETTCESDVALYTKCRRDRDLLFLKNAKKKVF